jgi:hypothetical protein
MDSEDMLYMSYGIKWRRKFEDLTADFGDLEIASHARCGF